jgi:hypothetical protein
MDGSLRSAFVENAGNFGSCDYPWLIRMMWMRMSQKWRNKLTMGETEKVMGKRDMVFFTSRASSSP